MINHDPESPDDGHECSCSEANAQELHELVAALAEHRGFDVCDPDDMPDDDDDEAMDLALIHDTLLAQGAHCTGMGHDDEDDEDDEDEHDGMDDDDSGEHDVSRFSDADDDEYDDEDFNADDLGLDVIDMDDDALTFADDDDSTEDDLPVVTFRDWPKAKRDETAPEDFAGPARTFPIVDQADVDAAEHLVGRAEDPDAVKAKIKAICKRKGLTIPAAWATGTAKMGDRTGNATDRSAIHGLATFALDSRPIADEEWVTYPNSLLFRSGDYPKRSFAMSPDELRRAAETFADPVPNELEHVNSQGIATILDGKLGHVAEVRASEDGSELRGTVVIPKWLDRVWGDGAKKVSCVWDRADKSLRKLGLVIQGHLPDAALMAAFSEAEFSTPRKKHDHTTAAHQAIHDVIRMGYPGVCSGGPMRPPGTDPDNDGDIDTMAGMSAADRAYFADHPQQLKSLRSIHATTVQNGAQCSGKATMSATTSRSKSMSDSITFTDEDIAALRAELDAEKAKSAETLARFAEAEKSIEASRVKQVKADAAAFANCLIGEGRAFSAEFSDLVEEFTEAADADHASKELVTFSDISGAKVKGSRVEKIRARYARRPAHSLFEPALGDGELLRDGEKVLFNGKATTDDDRAKADAVLAKTNDGRAILAKRAGK